MTEAELEQALVTKQPVIWRGRMDYETMTGQVTGILRRHEDGKDILSAQITSIMGTPCVMFCRPSQLRFWTPVDQKMREAENMS